jgi:hypothetical protein
MTDKPYPGYNPEIDPLPITCWGYALAEEGLARALEEERKKVALWYWDEDVQPNKMKKAAPLRAARYSFD